MQLCRVEEAFRTLKGDLGLLPVFHHKAERIEARIFVAFLAYCLSITLRQQLHSLVPGLMILNSAVAREVAGRKAMR